MPIFDEDNKLDNKLQERKKMRDKFKDDSEEFDLDKPEEIDPDEEFNADLNDNSEEFDQIDNEFDPKNKTKIEKLKEMSPRFFDLYHKYNVTLTSVESFLPYLLDNFDSDAIETFRSYDDKSKNSITSWLLANGFIEKNSNKMGYVSYTVNTDRELTLGDVSDFANYMVMRQNSSILQNKALNHKTRITDLVPHDNDKTGESVNAQNAIANSYNKFRNGLRSLKYVYSDVAERSLSMYIHSKLKPGEYNKIDFDVAIQNLINSNIFSNTFNKKPSNFTNFKSSFKDNIKNLSAFIAENFLSKLPEMQKKNKNIQIDAIRKKVFEYLSKAVQANTFEDVRTYIQDLKNYIIKTETVDADFIKGFDATVPFLSLNYSDYKLKLDMMHLISLKINSTTNKIENNTNIINNLEKLYNDLDNADVKTIDYTLNSLNILRSNAQNSEVKNYIEKLEKKLKSIFESNNALLQSYINKLISDIGFTNNNISDADPLSAYLCIDSFKSKYELLKNIVGSEFTEIIKDLESSVNTLPNLDGSNLNLDEVLKEVQSTNTQEISNDYRGVYNKLTSVKDKIKELISKYAGKMKDVKYNYRSVLDFSDYDNDLSSIKNYIEREFENALYVDDDGNDQIKDQNQYNQLLELRDKFEALNNMKRFDNNGDFSDDFKKAKTDFLKDIRNYNKLYRKPERQNADMYQFTRSRSLLRNPDIMTDDDVRELFADNYSTVIKSNLDFKSDTKNAEFKNLLDDLNKDKTNEDKIKAIKEFLLDNIETNDMRNILLRVLSDEDVQNFYSNRSVQNPENSLGNNYVGTLTRNTLDTLPTKTYVNKNYQNPYNTYKELVTEDFDINKAIHPEDYKLLKETNPEHFDETYRVRLRNELENATDRIYEFSIKDQKNKILNECNVILKNLQRAVEAISLNKEMRVDTDKSMISILPGIINKLKSPGDLNNLIRLLPSNTQQLDKLFSTINMQSVLSNYSEIADFNCNIINDRLKDFEEYILNITPKSTSDIKNSIITDMHTERENVSKNLDKTLLNIEDYTDEDKFLYSSYSKFLKQVYAEKLFTMNDLNKLLSLLYNNTQYDKLNIDKETFIANCYRLINYMTKNDELKSIPRDEVEKQLDFLLNNSQYLDAATNTFLKNYYNKDKDAVIDTLFNLLNTDTKSYKTYHAKPVLNYIIKKINTTKLSGWKTKLNSKLSSLSPDDPQYKPTVVSIVNTFISDLLEDVKKYYSNDESFQMLENDSSLLSELKAYLFKYFTDGLNIDNTEIATSVKNILAHELEEKDLLNENYNKIRNNKSVSRNKVITRDSYYKIANYYTVLQVEDLIAELFKENGQQISSSDVRIVYPELFAYALSETGLFAEDNKVVKGINNVDKLVNLANSCIAKIGDFYSDPYSTPARVYFGNGTYINKSDALFEFLDKKIKKLKYISGTEIDNALFATPREITKDYDFVKKIYDSRVLLGKQPPNAEATMLIKTLGHDIDSIDDTLEKLNDINTQLRKKLQTMLSNEKFGKYIDFDESALSLYLENPKDQNANPFRLLTDKFLSDNKNVEATDDYKALKKLDNSIVEIVKTLNNNRLSESEIRENLATLKKLRDLKNRVVQYEKEHGIVNQSTILQFNEDLLKVLNNGLSDLRREKTVLDGKIQNYSMHSDALMEALRNTSDTKTASSIFDKFLYTITATKLPEFKINRRPSTFISQFNRAIAEELNATYSDNIDVFKVKSNIIDADTNLVSCDVYMKPIYSESEANTLLIDAREEGIINSKRAKFNKYFSPISKNLKDLLNANNLLKEKGNYYITKDNRIGDYEECISIRYHNDNRDNSAAIITSDQLSNMNFKLNSINPYSNIIAIELQEFIDDLDLFNQKAFEGATTYKTTNEYDKRSFYRTYLRKIQSYVINSFIYEFDDKNLVRNDLSSKYTSDILNAVNKNPKIQDGAATVANAFLDKFIEAVNFIDNASDSYVFDNREYRQLNDDDIMNVMFKSIIGETPLNFVSGSADLLTSVEESFDDYQKSLLDQINNFNVETAFDSYKYVESHLNKFLHIIKAKKDNANLTDLFLSMGYTQEEVNENIEALSEKISYDPDKLKLEDLDSLPEPVMSYIDLNRMNETAAYMGVNDILISRYYEKVNKFFEALSSVLRKHKNWADLLPGNVSDNDANVELTKFLKSKNVNDQYDKYVLNSLNIILHRLRLPNTYIKLRIKGELIDLIKLAKSDDRFAALNYIRLVLVKLEDLCHTYSELNAKDNPDPTLVIGKIAAAYRDYSLPIMDEGINLLKKSSDPRSLKRFNIADYKSDSYYQKNLQYAVENGIIDPKDLDKGFYNGSNSHSDPEKELENNTVENVEKNTFSDESQSEQKDDLHKKTYYQKVQDAVDEMLSGKDIDEELKQDIEDTIDIAGEDDHTYSAEEYEEVVDPENKSIKDQILDEEQRKQSDRIKKNKKYKTNVDSNFDWTKKLDKDTMDAVNFLNNFIKNKE